MSVTSKSPSAVLRAALEVGRRALPAYSHRCSPKKFTQHQLFACLVLRNFLKTDYRGVVAQLQESPHLVAILGLEQIPHYTTLQKASKKLLASQRAKRLLDVTVRAQLQRRKRVATALVDSTGMACTVASTYFVKRRVRQDQSWKTMVYHRYAKLAVVADAGSHFILAFYTRRGPKPDVAEFKPLLQEALTRVRLSCIVADAGYDSEANHVLARDEHRVRTVIPAKHGRPSTKPAKGRHRRLMQTRFDSETYRQRAQVETVMSMIKRRQGAAVRGATYHSQCRELRLMALTHNVMILLFY